MTQFNAAALDASIDPLGPADDLVETVIVPRARDLGGFEVRRVLPPPQRQMVGPFIFFDQMGPAEFLTGEGHRRPAAPAYRPRHRHLPVRAARSCTATAWARCRRSRPATSTG